MCTPFLKASLKTETANSSLQTEGNIIKILFADSGRKGGETYCELFVYFSVVFIYIYL